MAKRNTPAMEKFNRKRAKGAKVVSRTPFQQAMERLFRNKVAILGMVIILLLILMAIFAPVICKYSYDDTDVRAMLKGPSRDHIFGTDKIGRDMFARCVYGARITLPIAFGACLCACLVGGTIGIVAAYFGGNVDVVIMRIVDIWGSIPGIMLPIAIVACLGNNMASLVVGLSCGAIPNMARNCRAAIFTVVDSEYVESSKTIGVSNFSIMFGHLLPNAVGPIILNVVGLLGIEVLNVSSLSFIGVGISPPTPEWGSLLSTGRQYLMSQPYLCVFPGLFIMLSVLGFSLVGDGLRDALDPRLK